MRDVLFVVTQDHMHLRVVGTGLRTPPDLGHGVDAFRQDLLGKDAAHRLVKTVKIIV